MKSQLSKEQSAHLIELGVSADKASASDSCVAYGNGVRGIMKASTAPIFTLTDLLELLPKGIIHNGLWCKLRITTWIDEPWFAAYQNQIGEYITTNPHNAPFSSEEFIDVLYELLCWVLGNRKLDKEK